MNKEEMYYAVLGMLAMSGQGVPVGLLKGRPKHEYDWDLTQELIDEGKLAIVETTTGPDHLIINDDRYYRLEVDDPDIKRIELMRYHLGIIQIDEKIDFFNVSPREIIDHDREGYDRWLGENKEKLDAVLELKAKLEAEGRI